MSALAVKTLKPEKANRTGLKWLTLFIIHYSLSIFHYSPAQNLSPQAKVSLITVLPGEALYSSFGHTAIRINDPANGIDQQYGWGTFDFDTDNFYVKFLRGTLPYWITGSDMYRFLYAYQRENRTVREQVLNLTDAQKQRLFAVIQENMRPENRTYQYKFYYDNCSTRPRDVLVRAAADSIRFSPAALDTTRSFREWMNDYLGGKPWARFGMNLGVGRPADERNSGWVAMWLPMNVFTQFEKASILTPSGRTLPLVAQTQTLFEALPQESTRSWTDVLLSPGGVFTLALLLVGWLTYRQHRQGRRGFSLDRLLFGFLGFWGWFLFLLWVATDHGVTAWNPALLMLMPLHLPLIFWISRPGNEKYIGAYFALTAVLAVLFYVYAVWHGYAFGLFPLLLLILVRCFHQVRYDSVIQQSTTRTLS